eukprot:10067302-Alexandrium_andersonii.AAC.1
MTPMVYVQQTADLLSVRSQLSAPEPTPDQDMEDSDVSSQANYTPIASTFTSDAEGGAHLGSEATSLADDESEDEPAAPATEDPYEEKDEVA